ncbi:hypothetical protein G3I40_32185 [Streptomyces sp. SID14478]|uniref:Ser-Thr-rich GPI-anchored membrane family protein n=1 Tax=Streptomyces sp. SID14478 TaxID=2706073 RepID=UPI0013DC4ECB|nr:Ser-Thr-rich GPI-anchored membrane family protein [Streptomyces sp. SID14478]NEB79843.1 hypothetical protein [Streptomyces sp. SID14478]
MPSTASLPALLRRAFRVLERPEVAIALDADSLVVRVPGEGARWEAGSTQTVAWWVVGPLGHRVDIRLVSGTGTRIRTEAVLVTEVDPHDLRARVTVPALAPGPYRVQITSAPGVLDAYSAPVTLAPA